MIRNLFGKPFPQSWPEGIRYTSPLKTFASQAKKVVTIGNIYFTASSDNGQTWNRNIRLNDVQPGVDGDPSLTIDEHGTLYALWRSCRESIFGDIYFAYSTDGGQSWSHSIKVNEGDELIYRQPRLDR